MPAVYATAPGKVILFGEHAVVYGQPAIAVPVTEIEARAVVLANPLAPTGEIHIDAPDIRLNANLSELPEDNPLRNLLICLAERLGIRSYPSFTLRLTSTIPLAAGLGSGAAVSVAAARAVASFMGHTLSPQEASELAFETEKIYHGSPSGIDNTVIAFEQPIYFIRGQQIEPLRTGEPFSLLVGDTGVKSTTSDVVGDLRQRWQKNPDLYNSHFEAIGKISRSARQIIENGSWRNLGSLMVENHALLQHLEVSHPMLDHLVQAALGAGALGAKMSGAGWGGNMIALVEQNQISIVEKSLLDAGALQVFRTNITAYSEEE